MYKNGQLLKKKTIFATYLGLEMIWEFGLKSPGDLQRLEHLRLSLYLQVQVVWVHLVLNINKCYMLQYRQ
jgi:hypothetical protein